VALPANWDDCDDESDLDEEEQGYIKASAAQVSMGLKDLPDADDDDELDEDERAYINSHKGSGRHDSDDDHDGKKAASFDDDLDEDEIAFIKARQGR